MFPGCESLAIKSHSQQKKGQLSSISEEGFVYAKNVKPYDYFKSSKSGNKEFFKKLPIGEASRFKGYCNGHDTSLFYPIENGLLDVNNEEHNFLLLLRAFSHEYASKREMFFWQKNVLAITGDLFGYNGRRSFEGRHLGIAEFLKKDAAYFMPLLFDLYGSKNWGAVGFNSFEVDRNLGVSSTTCFSPLGDEHGSWMNSRLNDPQPFVTFNLVPSSSATSISFSWLKGGDDLYEKFISIKKNQSDFYALLNMYAFTESEDTCVRPSLWERLTKYEQAIVFRLLGDRDITSDPADVPLILDV